MAEAERHPAAAAVPGTGLLSRDLVPVIARHLEEVGEYRTTLDVRDAQKLVDLRWAALGLGRQLGRKLQVVASRAVETRDGPVTVLVTYAEAVRRSIPRQRHPD